MSPLSKKSKFEIFKEESQKYYKTLEMAVKNGMNGKEQSLPCDELYRSAHNLKAICRLMNFNQIADLVAVLEEFFKKLKFHEQVDLHKWGSHKSRLIEIKKLLDATTEEG